MKKWKNIKIVALITALFIVAVGCEETTIITKVLPDGSCQRTIKVESDSAKLDRDKFPIPLDDSWTFGKEEQKKDGKTTYIYEARKSFASVRDLNKEFPENPLATPRLKREASLDKRFRWFYSFFSYREKVKELNPFKSIPMEDFFTEEEAAIVKQSLLDNDGLKGRYPQEELDRVEKKFNQWYAKNIFEGLYLALLHGARNVKYPQLTPEAISSKKDALFAAFQKEQAPLENLSLDQFFKTCERVLQVSDLGKIREANKEGFQQVLAKYNILDNILAYYFRNEVFMPGLIMATNADSLEGSSVTWDVEAGKFFFADYEMWVESRMVNWWTLWVTGALLLLIIAGLILGTLHRRKTNKPRL